MARGEDQTADPAHGVWTQEDRDFMDAHFGAIACRLIEKRLWRTNWRVEVNGCVVKLEAKGYPKKGTPIWEEREAQTVAAARGVG